MKTNKSYLFSIKSHHHFLGIYAQRAIIMANLDLSSLFTGISFDLVMTMALTPGIIMYLLPDQWKEQLRELINSYTEDQLDGCVAGLKALSGDCSSPEAAMQSASSSSIPNDTIVTRKSSQSCSPSASSSRFESFFKQNLVTLDFGSFEQLQEPLNRIINEQLEQMNLFGSSVLSTSTTPATNSGNHSRKSSQSSVQSGGIRFIPSHFNSRASSSSDLNEFELVSESECDSDGHVHTHWSIDSMILEVFWTLSRVHSCPFLARLSALTFVYKLFCFWIFYFCKTFSSLVKSIMSHFRHLGHKSTDYFVIFRQSSTCKKNNKRGWIRFLPRLNRCRVLLF